MAIYPCRIGNWGHQVLVVAVVLIARAMTSDQPARWTRQLGLSGAHATAFVCTAAARFGAGSAMVDFVLGALLGAGLANVGAQGADRLHVFTAPGHRRRGQLADSGAIHVERDAPRHHLDVLLLQACRGAVIARDSALVAGFNTGRMLLV
jgi:hypothetical protein